MERHGVGADKASDLVLVGSPLTSVLDLPLRVIAHLSLHLCLCLSLHLWLVVVSVLCLGRGRVARRAGRGSALCCPCCGLDLVGRNDNMCGE